MKRKHENNTKIVLSIETKEKYSEAENIRARWSQQKEDPQAENKQQFIYPLPQRDFSIYQILDLDLISPLTNFNPQYLARNLAFIKSKQSRTIQACWPPFWQKPACKDTPTLRFRSNHINTYHQTIKIMS